jgi:hypothetical protein
MLRIIIGALPLLILCAGTLSAQNPTAPIPFFCAQEGGTCRFAGTGMAYFGAGSVFAARAMTDGAACTTAVFGDPVPNVPKYCLTSAMPTQETECAPEGRNCAVSGPALMLYGANGVYSGKVVSQATACSKDVFGDPAPNVAKSCLLMNAPTPPPPPVQAASAPPTLAAPAVRPRQAPPRQVTRVTYATLELPPPVAGYMAANADGSVALNASEFMAVFFAVSGKDSPPASGDLVRLADVGGKSVLAPGATELWRCRPARRQLVRSTR